MISHVEVDLARGNECATILLQKERESHAREMISNLNLAICRRVQVST